MRIAVGGGDFDHHLRTPARVAVVQRDVGILGVVLRHEHPRIVGRVEALVVVEVFRFGHHRIAFLGLFRVLLGFGPLLHRQVGAGLQAVNHAQVGRRLVRALVVGQIALGLVEVLENELLPYLLVRGARVVRGFRVGRFFRDDGHGRGVFMTLVGLGCVHAGQVHVVEGAHGMGDARSHDMLLVGFFAGERDHHVAVLDPSVVDRPGNLADGVVGTQAHTAGVPCRELFVSRVFERDVLSHDVALEQERRIAEIVCIHIGVSGVEELAREGRGAGRDEVVEGVRRIARLIHGDGPLLREGLLQAAGGQEGCADKQRCCKFYGLFHR